MSVRQAITIAPRIIEVGSGPEPDPPGPGEALLAVASVGICGSDLAMWQGSDPYSRFPVRQGHECSGRILAFGPGHDGDLRTGQLVAVEPLLPDGTWGDGPRVVFEATGVAAVLRQAFDIAAHAGTVVIAGTPVEDVAVPVLDVVRKELDVLGSRNSTGLFPAAVSLVQREQARCESLITQRFPLEETQAAMEFGLANAGAVNKLMITVAG